MLGCSVPAQPSASGSRSVPTRVLVVDDAYDSAELLNVLLTQAGYDVRVAFSAQEAVGVVAEFVPDIAVLDLGLPGETGFDLIVMLKAIASMSGCRYVALTGYDVPSVIQQTVSAGFATHLVKPVPIAKLLGTIAGLQDSGVGNG